LTEYEALLYINLRETEQNEKEWEQLCGGRLPVIFFQHIEKWTASYSQIIGSIGSQRLIEYYLVKYAEQFSRDDIFIGICSNGHLSVAQWLYSLGDIDIHSEKDEAFRLACAFGHLSIAQWLYQLDRLNIHIRDDQAFQSVCMNNHLSVAQWLFSLRGVNIHAEYNESFQSACLGGYLSIAQWLYDQGGFDIHMEDDQIFRWTCGQGLIINCSMVM
jgi:hypothetical protein